ncbi:MAG TPA: phage portal protein [Geminicoccus sp.]|jgi:HK97 family phage portal protein|uniref:phage portal protein n=1 Tax=Geminicoccus sp. TaxID=2024832 RepID=UPI002E37DBD6|nr:phage portal protein [Geminicoccus sp.]HEX2524827.1 phage portal protein [Geminicoccus sp.]
MFDRLKHFLGIEKRYDLASSSPEMLALFGATPTAAGVSVSAESALRSPTTLAAVRAIAESVGSLPFHLYRRSADGSRERDNSHPAATLLAGDWCPWAGGVETKTGLQLDALLHGAACGQVIRTGSTPREIHRLDPRDVTRDTSGPEPRFKFSVNGVERTLDWRDVLYLPTPGSIGNRVVCLTHLAREAIALDLLMAEHQARLFSNGARPSGILKTGNKPLGPEVIKRLRESFNAAQAGGANSGRTLVLEDGMTFEPQQFSSTDSQFLELRRLVTQEIARAFKVPGTLIGDLDRATWRNVEELMRQFVQTCLMPWTEIWQSALERVLLTPEERREYFIECTFDDLLRGDLAGRFTAYRQATGGSWLTPNEVRALDNRPPIDGGDELIRQAGQADASSPTASQEPVNGA